MSKFILEYCVGNPDSLDQYDDKTNNLVRTWYYDNSKGISFGWFQTSLDGGKEFVSAVETSHYEITQKIARKIVGKAIASEDIFPDNVEDIGMLVNNIGAFKGRTFDTPKVITTWHKVSSEKLYEILENLGGVEKFQDYEYVYPTEYPYNGNKEILGNHMNVIEYINSHDTYVCPSDIKFMESDIKDSRAFPDWMIEIIRDYNRPNSALAAKTAKLGNMTIAQYNSLIHQESMEGKKTINEYFQGNPDEVYDTEKKIYHNWDNDSAITFGYFPVSLDDEYEFMSSKNMMHLNLANLAAQKVIGNSNLYFRQRYGKDGEIKLKNKVGNECMRRAYCKGRYWTYPKSKIPYPSLISFWKNPSSEQLKEICDRLNIDANNTIFIQSRLKPYHNMTVKEYIDGFYESDEEKTDWNFNSKLIKFIKDYHDVDNSWSAEKERNGWKTLAQRNATIYQEEKEPKDTIKENNMEKNKYQKEFSNYIEIMNEALKRNDFKAYSVAKSMLEETIEDCKQEKALLDEMNTNNFGVLNHIFEQQLPTLIKNNKRAVRDVIKAIKEDKNLLGQFNFYNAVKNQYKGDAANLVESKEVLERLAEISVKGINQATVKESNKKLKNIMLENNIIPTEFIDEENKQLYECGHIILTRKKTTSNMIPLIESYHNICQYMEKHKNDGVKNGKNIDEIIREFEEKLKTNLNESEISFVQQITDFRTPIAEQRKEKLFNKFKNECIEKVNAMLKEDAENVELIDLNRQISEMKFDKNNIVKDIAKLLEIRDILMDD